MGYGDTKPYICDIAMADVAFGKVNAPNAGDPAKMRKSIDLFHGAAKRDRLEFSLSLDTDDLLYAPFELQEGDGDGTRRTLLVNVGPAVEQALKAFEEKILDHAVEHSHEIFGRKLTRVQAQLVCPPIVSKSKNGEHTQFRFKVKCPPATVPTRIKVPGVTPNAFEELGADADLATVFTRGVSVYPVVRAMLWVIDGKLRASFQAEDLLVAPATARAAASARHISQVDFAALEFGKAPVAGPARGPKKVELVSKLRFALCTGTDKEAMLVAPHAFNIGKEDPTKGNVLVRLQHPEVVAAFQRLDEAIIAAAMANSKEWFKQEVTRELLEVMYSPFVPAENADKYVKLRLKYKRGDAPYPTKFIHVKEDGTEEPGTEALLEGENSLVAPTLSVYALWIVGDATLYVGIQAEEIKVRPGTGGGACPFRAPAKREAEVILEPAAKVAKVEKEAAGVMLEDEDGFAAM